MPSYHSRYNENTEVQVGNMAVLPLKTSFKGPAPKLSDPSVEDVVDEALLYFKANILFRQFEIKGPADRTLIYLMLYVIECLKRLQKCPKKTQAMKELTTMALESKLPIPGESGFPFQGLFKRQCVPFCSNCAKNLVGEKRRGSRLCDKVFASADAAPSKWWLCYAKRKFMDKSLSTSM